MVRRMEKVKVVLYGVGEMGKRIGLLLLKKEGVEIVGAVGRRRGVRQDLGEVLGLDKKLGIRVSDDLDAVLSKAKSDIVVNSTTSFLKEVYPQIATAVKHGVNMVSTCEELSYSYILDAQLCIQF